MAILFIRTIMVYALVVFSLRLMGKRQIGELQPSELVVAIMISDLASMPMSDVSVPLSYGVVPIFTLVICELVLSFFSLKSERIRVFLSGKPQLLVKGGRFERKEMLHARVNMDDLLEELRKLGYFSLSDVDTVILETSGSISVIPSKDSAPPTNKDLNINTSQQNIPYIFISDGKIRESELRRAGKDKTWLMKQLKKENISNSQDVFIFSVDGADTLYLQKRDDKN
jgi:uncharacterized membrane protein YcaP (DUF421 family)